jgi:hypothetical protein
MVLAVLGVAFLVEFVGVALVMDEAVYLVEVPLGEGVLDEATADFLPPEVEFCGLLDGVTTFLRELPTGTFLRTVSFEMNGWMACIATSWPAVLR